MNCILKYKNLSCGYQATFLASLSVPKLAFKTVYYVNVLHVYLSDHCFGLELGLIIQRTIVKKGTFERQTKFYI